LPVSHQGGGLKCFCSIISNGDRRSSITITYYHPITSLFFVQPRPLPNVVREPFCHRAVLLLKWVQSEPHNAKIRVLYEFFSSVFELQILHTCLTPTGTYLILPDTASLPCSTAPAGAFGPARPAGPPSGPGRASSRPLLGWRSDGSHV